MPEIIECIPNFSEGKNRDIIKAITDAIGAVEEVKLLDVDPGADTNRTVVTFIGTRKGILNGAFAGIARAAELIDMRKHSGAHARLGATDVCPLVPISGISMEECIELSRSLAERVARELKIPVYLYEKSARLPERQNLAEIRKGEYEGLPEKLKDPEWIPDYGKAVFNAKSGATVIGVREFLIAYNVNLNTRDRRLAHDIALTVREAGRVRRDKQGNILRDKNGEALKQPGVLPSCKAVGWYIDEYRKAQVSINLTNYKITPPHKVFEEIRSLANTQGLRVTGSEIVGLVPLEAMLMAGRYYLKAQGKSTGAPEKDLIETAIHSLGLNDVSIFDPAKKIIEYQFGEFENPLIKLSITNFIDELSTDSPAPGGGSVAALCGALAASLTAMVANLTYGKKGYERHFKRMNELAVKAQQLKTELLRLVDLDTAAFNRVMESMRLPKKTLEEQSIRETELQSTTKDASRIPLEVMKKACEVLTLAGVATRYGNVNSISDVGVAALAADAAVRGAAMNVKINLPEIKDPEFKQEILEQLSKLIIQARRQSRRIVRQVERKIESSL
jgi:glutamate formiminotransferase/formiminotetrahydrofolate cyclodeaminase